MKALTLVTSALSLVALLALSGCNEQPKPSEKTSEPKVASKQVASSTKLVPMEKMGFLTIDSCAEQGAFTDCYLENYVCGTDGCYKEYKPGEFGKVQLVLYSHVDGISYKLDTSKLDMSLIDTGINRNEVSIVGQYDATTNTLYAEEFKAPPPPKKSFFKGCL